ncbi:uncharacterized protein [Dermacentor albipictus]|uniref:uncharacterized protein n=1 Tax=Dermacentor albipictus TaxID=60249 RepID=UPI0031FC085A
MRWSVTFLTIAVLCGLLCARAEAKTYDEFRKDILAVKKDALSPPCKKVFAKCAPRLFSLLPLLPQLKKNWDTFQNLPCVKEAFAEGFPNYAWPCTKGGKYEKAINCLLSADVTKFFGPSEARMKTATQCLLDNV